MKFSDSRIWGAALAAAIAVGALWAIGAAITEAGNGRGHTPVTLCHWVPANGGSYIVITVDDDGANDNANLQGHAGHERDIIPAPEGGCPSNATTTPDPTGTAAPSVSATPTIIATITATETATATANASTPEAATNTPTSTATTASTETATESPTSTATATESAGAAASVPTNTAALGAQSQVLGAAAQPGPQQGVAGAQARPSGLPSAGYGDGGGSPYMPLALLALGCVGLAVMAREIRSRSRR